MRRVLERLGGVGAAVALAGGVLLGGGGSAAAAPEPPPHPGSDWVVMATCGGVTSRGDGVLNAWWNRNANTGERDVSVYSDKAISWPGAWYERTKIQTVQGRTVKVWTTTPYGTGFIFKVPRTNTGTVTVVQAWYASGHVAQCNLNTWL